MHTRVCKLRKWKQADQGWFRDLDYKCFPIDETFFNSTNYHWWIVYADAAVVGYAGLYVDKKGCAHLTRAGVLPEFRGSGLQKALIKARIRWCKRRKVRLVRTYTSCDNHASRANLEACGFRGRKCRRPKDGVEYVSYRLQLERGR